MEFITVNPEVTQTELKDNELSRDESCCGADKWVGGCNDIRSYM